MRTFVRVFVIAVLAATVACAPKTVPTPTVTAPKYPDITEPTIPSELAGRPAVAAHHRAWQLFQAGDLRSADRELAAILKSDAGFYPAETSAGLIDLARKDNKEAVDRFDRALTRNATYVPALVGRGQALALLGRDKEALDSFQSALAVDPSLTDVQRRIEVVKLRVVQHELTVARQAVKAGHPDEAIRSYQTAIESSPESAFLYREVAALEREKGDADAALGHYRRANALEPDAASLVAMAELLAARDDFDPAMRAYRDALAIDNDPTVQQALDELRQRAQYARLPAEFRAISTAAQITRADLAALIGQRMGVLLSATRPRDVGVITDVRGHWAEEWMLSVARAGVMDPLPNHTFAPRAVVRRQEFAQAVTRLLAKVAIVAPNQATRWQNARGRFTDISAGHVAYNAASAATASGVMTTTDGAFQPTRPVSGAEAIAALDRLSALTPRTVAAQQR